MRSIFSSTTAAAPRPTGPRGNLIKKVGEVIYWGGPTAQPSDPEFTVTKIAKQRSQYGGQQVMVVTFHVQTRSDAALAQELSLALTPVVYVTDPDSGESKSPGGAMEIGDRPEIFGTNKTYDFGYEFDLADVYDHGWLTINSNGGPGGGVDIQYDLR
ncbi:hypothetical protein [Amycolatopsis sp. ATCC 39116]|uniref:hypothetical protein n=1 Tax=Amycolatopsis sp. (strain ATCC 39116 / 75iv2) TaxID=385957 RepID=UPI00026258F9|nr:hypothetical protein [Amycolatopsis sp. ATCC 39116]